MWFVESSGSTQKRPAACTLLPLSHRRRCTQVLLEDIAGHQIRIWNLGKYLSCAIDKSTLRTVVVLKLVHHPRCWITLDGATSALRMPRCSHLAHVELMKKTLVESPLALTRKFSASRIVCPAPRAISL